MQISLTINYQLHCYKRFGELAGQSDAENTTHLKVFETKSQRWQRNLRKDIRGRKMAPTEERNKPICEGKAYG